MSEMDEMRREDLRRDEMSGDTLAPRRAHALLTHPLQPDAARRGRTRRRAEASPGQAAGAGAGDRPQSRRGAQLLEAGDRESMTTKWRDIQADFVDHPRQAMQDADALVAGLMQQLAKTFADERAQLEAQWSRGDDVSTEDLRVSLQRYRAFFERLLAV